MKKRMLSLALALLMVMSLCTGMTMRGPDGGMDEPTAAPSQQDTTPEEPGGDAPSADGEPTGTPAADETPAPEPSGEPEPQQGEAEATPAPAVNTLTAPAPAAETVTIRTLGYSHKGAPYLSKGAKDAQNVVHFTFDADKTADEFNYEFGSQTVNSEDVKVETELNGIKRAWFSLPTALSAGNTLLK